MYDTFWINTFMTADQSTYWARLTRISSTIRVFQTALYRTMFSQPSEKHARNTFYHRNKSWLLVLVSQVFAVFMNTAAKFLETKASAISPLQILAVRMVVTFCVSSLILWHRSSEDFPFGKKELRPLLILRAIGGVLAAIGFYCKHPKQHDYFIHNWSGYR